MLTQQKRIEIYCDILYKHFNVLLLSNTEAAELLNRSTTQLARWRKAGIGPVYQQDQKAGINAPVFYPIDTIAIFVLYCHQKSRQYFRILSSLRCLSA